MTPRKQEDIISKATQNKQSALTEMENVVKDQNNVDAERIDRMEDIEMNDNQSLVNSEVANSIIEAEEHEL